MNGEARAHSVTLLETIAQLAREEDEYRDVIVDLLENAKGFRELDDFDWRRLKMVFEDGDQESILVAIREVLLTQLDRWISLGYPACHEDWIAAA